MPGSFFEKEAWLIFRKPPSGSDFIMLPSNQVRFVLSAAFTKDDHNASSAITGRSLDLMHLCEELG